MVWSIPPPRDETLYTEWDVLEWLETARRLDFCRCVRWRIVTVREKHRSQWLINVAQMGSAEQRNEHSLSRIKFFRSPRVVSTRLTLCKIRFLQVRYSKDLMQRIVMVASVRGRRWFARVVSSSAMVCCSTLAGALQVGCTACHYASSRPYLVITITGTVPWLSQRSIDFLITNHAFAFSLLLFSLCK